MAIQELRTKGPSSSDSFQAERKAVDAVLKSSVFDHSPRLAALLEYITSCYFAGDVHLIKEYALATEVLGRGQTFDPSRDAIVRVEVHRLRKKLKEYYAGEGADDPVTLTIRTGQYVPVFVARGEADASPSPATEQGGDGKNADPETEPGRRNAAGLRFNSQGIRRLALVVSMSVLVLALIYLLYLGSGRKRVAHTGSAEENRSSGANSAMESFAADAGIRILCGYGNQKYTDSYGRNWESDRDYIGGRAISNPVHFVSRTYDTGLFQSMRTGKFRYHIPLTPGTYELRLYFVETQYGPNSPAGGGENSRVFDVYANGRPLLTNFDILADAGPNTADVRVFNDIRPNGGGFLDLFFKPGVSDPLLSAIAIQPVPEGRARPVRLVAQDKWITDGTGKTWSPDNFSAGGRYADIQHSVLGDDDPRLFRTEHYGHFSYAIPLDRGTYSATLYFAETYFGPHNPGGGGVGSRVFDVSCNGRNLLSKFDIFAAAGENHQLKKTFYGLHPNAQGKLLFLFEPEVNYASLFAIEILPEEDQQ